MATTAVSGAPETGESSDPGEGLGLSPTHSLTQRDAWGLLGLCCGSSDTSQNQLGRFPRNEFAQKGEKKKAKEKGKSGCPRGLSFQVCLSLCSTEMSLTRRLCTSSSRVASDLGNISTLNHFQFLNGKPQRNLRSLWLCLPLNSDLRVPSIIVRRHCLKISSNGLVSRQFCKKRKEIEGRH